MLSQKNIRYIIADNYSIIPVVKIMPEKNKKTGRNDPCPCGSGKKYKNCCMKKEKEEKKEKIQKSLKDKKFADDLIRILEEEDEVDLFANLKPIEADAIPDYGEFPEGLITFDPINSLSMNNPVMLYEELCSGIEEQEMFEDKISGILEERNLFEQKINAEDPKSFFADADEYYISVHSASSIKTAMDFGEKAGQFIFEKLKSTESVVMTEYYVKVLHFIPHDFREGILEVMNTPPKNPYVLSALCIELLFYHNPDDVQILWNCYNFFKEYYPGIPLHEGPAIALNRVLSSG